ncbi:MAG: ParB/RepB/Spo0J family partition protein [Candidatus Aminicenantes bacterium]|nr:ParB/RepB/Spo0J family partition protein [Candidatus Aminicenantes bacterium]
MKKQALGKGLKAFIPEDYAILKDERLVDLDIDQIKPNPNQPRQNFDSQSIDELAQSIKESGVLQPVVVVAEEGFYKIILGERRWRAAQRVGLKKIPTLIRSIPKQKQLEASLVENIQREDLNPIEIAHAYKNLTEELNYTQKDIAERVGKDRTSVTNYLRLLKLPQTIQKQIEKGDLSMGHARALITLENPETQLALAAEITQKKLSVREVEKKITSLKRKKEAKMECPAERNDPDLAALEEEFVKILGTKTAITGNRDKGMIKIFYFSMDELNRLYEKIKGV